MTKGSVRESAGTCRRVATTSGTNTTWRVHDGNGGSLPSSGFGRRYLFQGREYTWAIHAATGGTGLYNFRARHYDPLTGRWLSNDPIGISGGLNQYAFCANNPVMFVDPEGEAADVNWISPTSEKFITAQNAVIPVVDGRNVIAVVAEGFRDQDGRVQPQKAMPTRVDERGIQRYRYEPRTASDLADAIKNLPNYQPGSIMILVICYAGGGNAVWHRDLLSCFRTI